MSAQILRGLEFNTEEEKMSRDEIMQALARLQHELGSEEALDENTRSSLRALTEDIRRLLDNGVSGGATDEAKSLSERVRESVIEFEVRHPVIGGLLERLTDGLANMGI